MKKLQLVIVAALALALPGPSVAAPAATIPVTISATAFSPKTVTLNFADSIRWRNTDKVNHQLVADSGAFASPILKPGDSYTFTFKTAGKFTYHDALKPSLKGTVNVKGLPPAVTLGGRLPIVIYGQQTTLSGTVNNGQAGETIQVNSQPVRLVRPAGRHPDDRRRRELHLRDHAQHLHDVQRQVEDGVEPDRHRAGPAEAHADAFEQVALLREGDRDSVVCRADDLLPAALAVRPVGDGLEAEARAARRAHLQRPAPEGNDLLPRLHDHEPGGARLPRDVEQLGPHPLQHVAARVRQS